MAIGIWYRVHFFTLLVISNLCAVAQYTNHFIEHDGLDRLFKVHVPPGYDSTAAIPLLLNFHRYGGNASQHIRITRFEDIADSANFIVVVPQGTDLNNEGRLGWDNYIEGAEVDDFGFVAAMLDSLSEVMAIDQNRIYSTGHSNGGYFSFMLACEMGDRITAVAPVAALMNQGIFENCTPQHPTSVMAVMGTLDHQYINDFPGPNINELIDYWSEINDCNTQGDTLELGRTTGDGNTIDKIIRHSGKNGTSVLFYRINNAGHPWPTANSTSGFHMAGEIWKYLSQFDRYGRVAIDFSNQSFSVKENPAPNDFVGKVEFIGHNLTFEILSGNSDDAFLIDSLGTIRVYNFEAINYESIPQYDILVKVSNASRSAQAVISITVEDLNEMPITDNYHFNILPDLEIGTVIGEIIAWDQDGDSLFYEITEGNDDEIFGIEPDGKLFLQNKLDISAFWDTKKFLLNIVVNDGFLWDISHTLINVLPISVLSSLSQNVRVFPNPLRNYFQIQSKSKPTKIKLYDLTGSLVRTFNPTKAQHDTSNILPGIYLLQIDFLRNTKYFRLIIF